MVWKAKVDLLCFIGVWGWWDSVRVFSSYLLCFSIRCVCGGGGGGEGLCALIYNSTFCCFFVCVCCFLILCNFFGFVRFLVCLFCFCVVGAFFVCFVFGWFGVVGPARIYFELLPHREIPPLPTHLPGSKNKEGAKKHFLGLSPI